LVTKNVGGIEESLALGKTVEIRKIERYRTFLAFCRLSFGWQSLILQFLSFSIDKVKNMSESKEGFKEVLIEPLQQFAKDSMHLVKKCTKPDRKEFTAIARATGVGFLIMGFIGFFVKLIHIPINNILVGN
jgi:protein transport protein SEC61 subunit gamma-like protein